MNESGEPTMSLKYTLSSDIEVAWKDDDRVTIENDNGKISVSQAELMELVVSLIEEAAFREAVSEADVMRLKAALGLTEPEPETQGQRPTARVGVPTLAGASRRNAGDWIQELCDALNKKLPRSYRLGGRSDAAVLEKTAIEGVVWDFIYPRFSPTQEIVEAILRKVGDLGSVDRDFLCDIIKEIEEAALIANSL